MKNFELNTIEDVKAFFTSLYQEYRLIWHPDDPFYEYVGEDEQPLLTNEEADYLQAKMEEAFEICETFNEDIYALAYQVQVAEMNLPTQTI